jgi:hypothetical protein
VSTPPRSCTPPSAGVVHGVNAVPLCRLPARLHFSGELPIPPNLSPFSFVSSCPLSGSHLVPPLAAPVPRRRSVFSLFRVVAAAYFQFQQTAWFKETFNLRCYISKIASLALLSLLQLL